MIRTILLGAVIAASAAVAEAAGFVYVAVPAPPCAVVAPCDPPVVLVVDAGTAAVVKRLFLPVHTVPAGIAISPDGAHLYVSNAAADSFGATSITVVDARRHAVVASYPLATGDFGKLAVRRDESRVFLLIGAALQQARVAVFDTVTHTVTTSFDLPNDGNSVISENLPEVGVAIAAHPTLDRFYVHSGSPIFGGHSRVTAYDAGSLAQIVRHQAALRGPSDMILSRDAQKLHALNFGTGTNPFPSYARLTHDSVSLALLSQGGAFGSAWGNSAESPATNELLTFTGAVLQMLPLDSSAVRNIPLPGEGLAAAVPPGDSHAFVTTTAIHLGQSDALLMIHLESGAIVHHSVLPPMRPARHMTSTPAGAEACSYRLASAYSSFPLTGGTGSIRLTTACEWEASSTEAWARISSTAGSGTATIGLTVDPNVLPTPRTATLTIGGQLVTVTQAGAYSAPPFGVIDTPTDGVGGVTGSLAITGWALDDVGVARVRVFRDPVDGEPGTLIYIGGATFVEGSRPDVQAFMPDAPFANRAGWGYLLLTNMLPNGGNGTFRLAVFAEDVEGQSSLIGTRVITAANATASVPFGAIDTPGQGETVSGVIVNFGWALTPSPGMIPSSGLTIDVLIDNVVVGHPTYNNFRADIASLFPGYANSGGAVGFFVLDTRTLTNGVHTIAWVVRDDLGRAQGIGSRFFTVFN